MDELAKAITELIRTGAPLGATAIQWDFIIRLSEQVLNLVAILSAFGTAIFIFIRIQNYLRWIRTKEMESADRKGQPYEAPRHGEGF